VKISVPYPSEFKHIIHETFVRIIVLGALQCHAVRKSVNNWTSIAGNHQVRDDYNQGSLITRVGKLHLEVNLKKPDQVLEASIMAC
jgi:hypothetical protein